MSRLIIKGLPSRYDDKQLRELFSFAGEVTDAKVIKTREGRSRQFGFIGFRTAQAAKHAQHQLNKTYVDTAQVTVDFAQSIGCEAIPRPWSKYSKGSSKHDEKERKQDDEFRKKFLEKEHKRLKKQMQAAALNRKNESDELGDNGIFSEFHAVSEKRSTNPIWADGSTVRKEKKSLVPSRKNGANGSLLEKTHITFDDDNDEDDAMYEDLPATKIKKEPPSKSEDGTGNTVALDQDISDMDYFRSKIISEKDEQNQKKNDDNIESTSQDDKESQKSEDSISEASRESDTDNEDDEKGGQSDKQIEGSENGEHNKSYEKSEGTDPKKENCETDVTETGRLFIRNLAYSITEDELEEVFEKYGPLSDVHIIRDSAKQSRGMGFVQYMVYENAAPALMELDGQTHCGRILRITVAQPRPEQKNPHQGIKSFKTGSSSSSFKNEKDEAMKEAARKGSDGIAQDPMHLAQDAVANVAASKHGVSKSELLGTGQGESGTAAVRLAIAEASLQSETKQFLLENGINLEIASKVALEMNLNTTAAKKKRMSRRAFLVKNLPARTKADDLDKIFKKYGEIDRLVVVPSGVLAVVEFENAHGAKKAFSNLAYTRFKDTPLYLEWLPTEALQQPKSAVAAVEDENNDINKKNQKEDQLKEEKALNKENSRATTVFVKNLNFSTRDNSLREHIQTILKRHSEIRQSFKSAKVALKSKNKSDNSATLSMGFGFLEFGKKESAIEFIKLAQNTVLEGHSLQFSLSNQQHTDDQSSNRKKRKSASSSKTITAKLIVRNIAFEATRKDIRQLFSTFGQLKSVRLPKKVDGSHRGFAFVEFVSKNEATSALSALTSSHLYGRHLVIEYASETSTGFASVAELQAQAAQHVSRKRIRLNGNGNNKFANNEEQHENDEQAQLEDALYG